MEVKVLFFASLADRLKVREIKIDLPLKSSVSDAVETLTQRYPALAEVHSTLAFAVNLDYVQPGYVLADGDELALIPPVSGG